MLQAASRERRLYERSPEQRRMVRPSGVEPPLLSEHGPEPCASANSATGAPWNLPGFRPATGSAGDKPALRQCQRLRRVRAEAGIPMVAHHQNPLSALQGGEGGAHAKGVGG